MSAKDLALLHFQRLSEGEAKRRLRRKNDILVARKSRAAGARTTPRECADSRSFAATGQAADQRADRSAAARQHGRALAFALGCLTNYRSLYGAIRAPEIYRRQLQRQGGAARETPERFGIDHSTTSRGTGRDRGPAINHDRTGHSSGKTLTGLAKLGTDSLSQA